MIYFRLLIMMVLIIPNILRADEVRIIPAVQSIKQERSLMVLTNTPKISYSVGLKEEAYMLKQYLKEDFNIQALFSTDDADIELKLEKTSNVLNKDAYDVGINDKIRISSASTSGIFYGIQTLRQIIKQRKNALTVPKLTIHDYPTYKWRAFMLDEARAFKGIEVVKGLLDEMARLKMNVFHWHLTDDQGWRIEIKKYPKLADVASKRDSTQIGGYRGKTFDGVPHSGYYTQKEIKEIVEYAKKRHIMIVPEFEMPGHESAAIAAYPWLGTTKMQIKVPCSFGVQYEVMDVSSPKVIRFIEDVIDEIITLFPSSVIHIGGDEVKYDQWKASDKMRKYMKENSISTPADLQIAFTNKVSHILSRKGRKMMGWNDIMGNKIHEYNSEDDAKSSEKPADGTIVQFWKGDTTLIKETAEKGYDIVNSYHDMTYLDYDYSKIPLRKAYYFNPIPANLPENLKKKIIGLGCQMWGEEIMSNERMYKMIYPRIAAYAETGWTNEKKKDYVSFKKALSVLIDIWENKGYLSNPTKYVNPLIGTSGMGHTFPGACSPFGLVQLSPDTDTIAHNIDGVYNKKTYDYCAGYQYGDSTIVGFSHTHLSGTGHSDLGDILIMPDAGNLKLTPGRASNPDEGYRSRFNHDTEVARPGYYEVMLDDHGIKAQLTATQRVGVHKYTFPRSIDLGRIILDLNHGIYNYNGKTLWASIRVENDTLITGYRLTNGWARNNYIYFAMSLSQPIKNYGYKDMEPIKYKGFWHKFNVEKNFPEMAGRKLVAYFEFDTAKESDLTIKVGISGVSSDGALANLKAETAGKNFDMIAKDVNNTWNKQLSSIRVEGTNDQKTMFYTSYYHTLINPSVYTDIDGCYRGIDGNIHKAKGFTNYTVFSLWDTYRAEHPFLNLMKPLQNMDMAKSMIRHQRQSVHGMLPIWSHMGNENWCMSGYHSVSVLSDAIVSGANIDKNEALDAMVKTSKVTYYDGLGHYMKFGYVPFEYSSTSASATLEYSYDDWCIYNVAKMAGEDSIANEYYGRALNYRKLFNPKIGFVCPRLTNGTFKHDFNSLQTHGEGFIEGNSWNFSFHVPHDVNGLIKMMGGNKKFIKRLDSLFCMELPNQYYERNEDIRKECLLGGYVHGNEPSHHVPYLYAWTSQPWKTQYWVREILNKMYKNAITGLSGNDDCGQMSAWYIFSSLGLYPVCPGTGQFVLSAPYMPYQELFLPNGKTFIIKAPETSDNKRYVRSVKLNGKIYDKMYITYKDIMSGGVLEFVMSSIPNKSRGKNANDKPYSLTN